MRTRYRVVIKMAVSYAPFSWMLSQKYLEQIQNTYPCAALSVLGRTWAKRGIFSLSLGEGPDNVLLLAGLQAEDSAAPLLLYRFFERLCDSYEKDSTLRAVKIRRSLRGRRITVVPCLNPDAYEIRRYGAVGAGCYAGLVSRASHRSYDNWRANARGVNVAHNFDYRHTPVLLERENTAAQPRPAPFSYAGPTAESETETQTLVRLCKRDSFRHAVVLSGTGGRIFWAAPDAHTDRSDTPLTAKIFAAAGEYTLSQKDDAIRHGCFTEWFAKECQSPAFEIAPRIQGRIQTQADFDALYEQAEELLVLAAIM